MAYNFVADSIHMEKLSSRREVQFQTKNGRFAFYEPPLGA